MDFYTTSQFLIFAAIFSTAMLSLAFVLAGKIEKVKRAQSEINKLKKSLEEMDEQAKLIVRTDIELNKTQEVLDKKIAGLFALQRLSRAISSTLEEEQVFKYIQESHLEDFGFEKVLAFLYNKQKGFYLALNIGYNPQEANVLLSGLDKNFYLEFIKETKAISSVAEEENQFKDKISKFFMARSFVLAPIFPKEGDRGFFFVGTDSEENTLTEGDKELITILANQIGQTLENARLFDQTWQSQQELEKKVEQRTAELTAAIEQIKAISKRKSDFISAVSHELRTPLTSIKGYAAILLSEKLGGLPMAVKERLDKINRHSDELTHLVNDLLDISRIESGKVTMKREPIDLAEAVASVSDLLSVQLKEKEIQFSTQISKNANLVIADRQQLLRVFINLLGNALKFTPTNGKIIITTSLKNNLVQIDVSDTGIGIPPEAQPAIFEEFYRVENTINEQVKGSGLGLSLVKHIVEAHGGQIWFKSKPGEGTTFSFTLPK